MNDDDNEQLRQQVELEEPWLRNQLRRDIAWQQQQAWRLECKEWFVNFEAKMREIFK